MRSIVLLLILAVLIPASLARAGVDMIDNSTHGKSSQGHNKGTKKSKSTVTTVTTSTSKTPQPSNVYTVDYSDILFMEWHYVQTRPIAPLATGTKYMLTPTAEQLKERKKFNCPPTEPMPLDTSLMVYVPKEQPVP